MPISKQESYRRFVVGPDLYERVMWGMHPDIDPASGIHGVPHWMRVCENGLRLAQDVGVHKRMGIDIEVVKLFSLLHDSCRHNDGHDPDHGPRAARRVMQWQSHNLLPIDRTRAYVLAEACEIHTSAYRYDGHNATIACCLDADRLDLCRIGIEPDPDRLSLPKSHHWIEAAKCMFDRTA